jgi:hypothetical protein
LVRRSPPLVSIRSDTSLAQQSRPQWLVSSSTNFSLGNWRMRPTCRAMTKLLPSASDS